MKRRLILHLLNNAPVVLLGLVMAILSLLSPRFLELRNLSNIVVQSSSTAIIAVGMTFVLLTAGVDLSVGAIMFIAAAVAGKMVLQGVSLGVAVLVILAIGAVCGAVNAAFIARLRMVPFIVTLAALYLGRGFALWLTETRAMNLPETFLQIGTGRVAGVPIPVVILALVALTAHLLLTRTPFGRQIYAVGHNAEMARKAGINTRTIIASVYIISGLCAAIGGIVSLGQLGAVSPTFGLQKEFAAIAAAVLGGTSLFGGRGSVLPGTLLGAVLIQTVENALVIRNADPYLYPLITSAIIFLAVLLDSVRTRTLSSMNRRMIRLEAPATEPETHEKSPF